MNAEPPANLARRAVEDGARAYFAARRDRIPDFVRRHFSLRGTLALHRVAVGWDILRAPVNLTLAAPQLAMHLAGAAAAKAGANSAAKWLRRPILLRTAVMRELEWLIHTDLLELPFTQTHPPRHSEKDALAQAILAAPAVDQALQAIMPEVAAHGTDPEFRQRLAHAMETYGVTRSAAAEITTGLLNLGAGAIALNKITPGAATLGPALAGVMAHQTAVAAFPLGAWLGSAWYGLFPVYPSAAMTLGATGGLMLAATTVAAFSGIIADPIQRQFGLHQARLLRMVNGLEAQFFDPRSRGFAAHDHYVARLLDVFDMVAAALRIASA
jgi:hypothetical protein